MLVRTAASVCTAIHCCNDREVTLAKTNHDRIAAYTTNVKVHQAIKKIFADQAPQTHVIPPNANHSRVLLVVFAGNLAQAQQLIARS